MSQYLYFVFQHHFATVILILCKFKAGVILHILVIISLLNVRLFRIIGSFFLKHIRKHEFNKFKLALMLMAHKIFCDKPIYSYGSKLFKSR